MRIPLAAPRIGAEEIEAVSEVLRSGQLVQGPRVAQFEDALSARLAVDHAVAVSSGTAALHLALLSSGIGPGDRVAVPAFSWPATANVVVLAGAQPVFVDIDPVTFCLDPDDLARRVEAEPVRAVLPVHAFGGMADMARLVAVAADHDCVVIEDAACAIGASLDFRPAGTWGALGCFSFHPRKTVTTGEGGLVVTASESVAHTLRALRNHGLDPSADAPDFIEAGFNYRLTEIQAALGIVQLRRLESLLAERRSRAAVYDEMLHGTDVTPPGAMPGSAHSYQSYVVLLPSSLGAVSGDVIRAMRAAGAEATIGTYNIPSTSYHRRMGGHGVGDFPVTDDVAARAVTLPLHPGITDDEQAEVVSLLVSSMKALSSPVRL